ncbi:MAG: M15 family metallopeptidase [Fibrobacter sp.]|jgi:D-alanyl-D-alanine dipeptidase|nr:M15 family metallopeptidase [Fibrobacter sp.]
MNVKQFLEMHLMKFWSLLFLIPFFLYAQEKIEVHYFVPTPPEKPLRFCTAYAEWLAWAESQPDYTELFPDSLKTFDIRYATFQNVTGHDLYCGLTRLFLHKDLAKKLEKASQILKEKYPGIRFRIFDGARPLYAQEALRAMVRGTPYVRFVTSPGTGSVHNFGYAIDLTLEDFSGNMLDMGTDFDSFAPKAGRNGEAKALKEGTLTEEQIANRNLLRSVMKAAGFIELPSEWWHFNGALSRWVRENISKTPF